MSWNIKTKYRKINKETVGIDKDGIIDTIHRYESRSMHGQLPVIWDRAKDFSVWDIHGNKFIDFSSTIFVTNTGHGNPSIIKAITTMLKKPLFHAYTYPTKIRADYLEFLIQNLRSECGDWVEKAFLVSSGTEAIECSIKLMRMYGKLVSPKKNKIISFTGNWHGRTLGAQMLSSVSKQKEWIGYEDPNIIRLPFPYPWDVNESNGRDVFAKNLVEYGVKGEEVAGFVLESYQGWACAFYPESFVKAIKEYSFKHGAVLTFDEIQSGFGRTGKMFAYQHYGVSPDLVCCGKGCSSGFPLAMVVGKEHLLDLPDVGSMSSTHSANPLACASGLANLNYMLDRNLVRNSEILGYTFQGELRKLISRFPKLINRVEGKGLVAAVYFNDEKTATAVSNQCIMYGLIPVHTGRETIKLGPPLTITYEAMMEGLYAFFCAVMYNS
jgi:4-aminobutyrate aminotransferase-like enzyme